MKKFKKWLCTTLVATITWGSCGLNHVSATDPCSATEDYYLTGKIAPSNLYHFVEGSVICNRDFTKAVMQSLFQTVTDYWYLPQEELNIQIIYKCLWLLNIFGTKDINYCDKEEMQRLQPFGKIDEYTQRLFNFWKQAACYEEPPGQTMLLLDIGYDLNECFFVVSLVNDGETGIYNFRITWISENSKNEEDNFFNIDYADCPLVAQE